MALATKTKVFANPKHEIDVILILFKIISEALNATKIRVFVITNIFF
jgi:hypothetical protein